MEEALGEADELAGYADIENWRLIMLDSTIPQQVGGNINDSQMAFLREQLEQSKDKHVMICLHHHPIKMD